MTARFLRLYASHCATTTRDKCEKITEHDAAKRRSLAPDIENKSLQFSSVLNVEVRQATIIRIFGGGGGGGGRR